MSAQPALVPAFVNQDTDALLGILALARRPCPDLEAEVVRRHLWLVDGLTRSYVERGKHGRSFEAAAQAALWTAVHSFDQHSGEFVPFAMIVVITEVRRELRDVAC